MQTGNAVAVTATVVSWTDWLPPVLSAIATTMTIVWMGIQMTIVLKNYLEKRELARGPRGKQGEPGPAGVTIAPIDKPIVIAPTDLLKAEQDVLNFHPVDPTK